MIPLLAVPRKRFIMPNGGKVVSALAATLKSLREERGIKQEGLAETLGLSQSAVSGWEKENKVPEVETLVRLADLYDVDLRWLVTGDGVRDRRDPPVAAIRLETIRLIAAPAFDATEPEAHAMLDAARRLASSDTEGGGTRTAES